MESNMIVLITPIEGGGEEKTICDCTTSYGCRITESLLAGYMDGVMVAIDCKVE